MGWGKNIHEPSRSPSLFAGKIRPVHISKNSARAAGKFFFVRFFCRLRVGGQKKKRTQAKIKPAI